jgi:phenylalanyl-tRNA synthetase beta chain
MKTTYNWLKDFVDIKLEPKELAHRLTMAGLEVTSLEDRDGDFVFEIEITSNRPDWLSVIGIAREVAAITGARLKLPKVQTKSGKLSGTTEDFKISIEDKKDCPLYTAKIIRGVKVCPSEQWLKERLELIGCRSVNNIVDITNYILFTYGEPLHAFDLDKLKGDTIFIRRAGNNEKITAINGEEYKLNNEVLVIADADGPVAVAGVMGGKDTEVNESTKNILLEAAVFDPLVIRRGRRIFGLQSDSSYRFERGIDFNIVEPASWKVVDFAQGTGAKCVLAKTSTPPNPKKVQVALDVSRACKMLGVSIEIAKIKKILAALGFGLKSGSKKIIKVLIPSYRPDINSQVDLVEEIARIFGFERMPVSVPRVPAQVSAFDKRNAISLAKNILVGTGLNEAITNSLIDRDFLKGFDTPQPIAVLNPLSKEQEILRPTLVPSLLRCVAHNLNQKQGYINLFEVGKSFFVSGNDYCEEDLLGIVLCGMRPLLLEQGLIKDEASLLHLKGILEVLFERLGIQGYRFETIAGTGEAAIFLGKERIGTMRQVSSSVLEALDIKNKGVFTAELSLCRALGCVNLKKQFVSLPVYPAISRDISFMIGEDAKIEDVLQALTRQGQPLLREIKVTDYYKGKQIPAGFRALTVSCLYRLDERTLTENEVNPVHNSVLSVLTEKFGAKTR